MVSITKRPRSKAGPWYDSDGATLFSDRFLMGERDGSRRNDGRDRVLVDHLRHGVFQQDDVLVERIDLALQLDAVYQIDRDLHMLLTELVQKRVLQ
ncbi:MAG: hypothetical protein JWN18_342 [Parcubacteria group bacterium]|nr:hypothetical protein [Parcubacteria group bacterium]